MNKNLKKVISAVAALAMTASSFVAFAANYPDVDATASYKQAVDELSALKVLEGYEDGTFQPDKLVNRAEFSKMVIAALGRAELAQAEASKGTDTQFTDVKGDHWASGYITSAVASGIINGMGDGTFAPDSNITYAQAMKMLVCAAGYEQWSVDQGGWPTGYMYWGNQLNVGRGVKDVTEATEITRAQCAQMIDNVLDAPVCVQTGKMSYDAYGNKYPELTAKDGNGIGYQTILTKNHDAYKVKGTVTETYRSSGAGKADEVSFTIQNAKNWLNQDDAISKKNDNAETIKLKVGESDVADYLKQYVEVLIQETDDDEYVAISASIAGQTDEVVLEAADFDYENSNYEDGDYVAAGKLYFYSNSKTSSYKIDENVELYVNGVQFEDVNAGIAAYVNDNETSKVTLVDTPSEDSTTTDGKYDLILVDAYATFVVDTVDDAETDEPTINSLDDTAGIGSWDIDFTDEEVTYTFTKDGKEISVADLAQYDVLSIKYNINDNFEDSTFYEAVVATKTETGKYSLYNSAEKEYTINGTKYKVHDMVGTLDSGTTYVFYLDAFGKIAYVDEEESVQKLAILDSAYTENSGYDKATIILADGSSNTYNLKDTTENIAKAKEIVYVDGNGGTKKPVQDRVVEYSLNSSNELTVKKNVAYASKDSASIADGEYVERSERIGSAKISMDSTAFLNIEDAKNITVMNASTFVDGDSYTAYAYDKASDSTYRFVLVNGGTGNYTTATRLAVFNNVFETLDDNDNTVDALELFVNGEVATYNCEDGVDADSFNLSVGDVILCKTNSENEIVDVTTVYTATSDWSAALTSTTAQIATGKAFVSSLTGKYDADLYLGAVVNRNSDKSVDISAIENNISSADGENFGFASDVQVYVVDYNEKATNRIKVGSVSSIVKTNVSNNAYVDDNKTEVNWSENGNNSEPRLALIKTVDGDASDIVYIIPKKN